MAPTQHNIRTSASPLYRRGTDSKQLTAETRDKLFKVIKVGTSQPPAQQTSPLHIIVTALLIQHSDDYMGWIARVLTPAEISTGMLGR